METGDYTSLVPIQGRLDRAKQHFDTVNYRTNAKIEAERTRIRRKHKDLDDNNKLRILEEIKTLDDHFGAHQQEMAKIQQDMGQLNDRRRQLMATLDGPERAREAKKRSAEMDFEFEAARVRLVAEGQEMKNMVQHWVLNGGDDPLLASQLNLKLYHSPKPDDDEMHLDGTALSNAALDNTSLGNTAIQGTTLNNTARDHTTIGNTAIDGATPEGKAFNSEALSDMAHDDTALDEEELDPGHESIIPSDICHQEQSEEKGMRTTFPMIAQGQKRRHSAMRNLTKGSISESGIHWGVGLCHDDSEGYEDTKTPSPTRASSKRQRATMSRFADDIPFDIRYSRDDQANIRGIHQAQPPTIEFEVFNVENR